MNSHLRLNEFMTKIFEVKIIDKGKVGRNSKYLVLKGTALCRREWLVALSLITDKGRVDRKDYF